MWLSKIWPFAWEEVPRQEIAPPSRVLPFRLCAGPWRSFGEKFWGEVLAKQGSDRPSSLRRGAAAFRKLTSVGLGFVAVLLLLLGLTFASPRAGGDIVPPVGFFPGEPSSPLFDPQLTLDKEGRMLVGKSQKRGYLANLFWVQADHCEKRLEACALANEAQQRVLEILQTRHIVLWQMPWENRFGEPAFWLYFGKEKLKNRRGNRDLKPDKKEQGQWLQHWMLREGLAYLWPENRTKLSDRALHRLRVMEQQAQQEGKGLWKKRELGLQHLTAMRGTFAEDQPYLPAFYLVEGTVQTIARRGQRLYINFGEDWRKDATLALSLDRLKKASWQDFWRGRLGAAKIEISKKIRAKDLKSFFELCQDCKIRARGWWYERHGPQMVLTSPRQLQVLVPQDHSSDFHD